MQIILKAMAGQEELVIRRATDALKIALKSAAAERIRVDRVFPKGTPGNRGRLLSAELPDQVTRADFERVLKSLRALAGVEYAEEPSPKKPM